jgi:Arc/MetJ family transcription regulator
VSPLTGTLRFVPTTKPRIQVTVDDELDAALRQLGGDKSRSRAVHDLALRGAEAIRTEREGKREAIAHLLRIANGEDDGYDFAVTEQMHAERP